ncbi:MAG: Ig-like domain-containing protein [Caldilineaceae bacterium]|nr:Ig-like domain-containing protein [Caldilineaceae bacterium]
MYSRNRQPVTIVAHSMGGLVSRAALLDPSTRNKVKTLYTIQTPHAGLPSAYIGCSHQQIGACEMEIDNMKSNFNPVVKNQRGTNYIFIGSDYSPFFNTYFGSGKHDGLVGSNSGVGWNDAGKFEPAGWISNSPPVQFVTDEVHSERYKKEVVFNSFRSIGNSIELSQSYRCIKYWMNDAKPPFSIVPSYCRLPSTSVVATNLDGTAQDPTQLIMHVSGHIGPTQTAEESASIDPTDTTMFSLAWTTGTLDFVLISPNGELVDPTFANSHPNLVSYTHHVGSADAGPIASYLLAGAMPGLWRMRITAVGIEMSGVDYDLFVTAQTKRTLTAQMNKQSYDLGETATIIATLQQDGVGFYDATVVANAKRSDGVIDTLLLADQGNGVYSAAYEIPSAAGFLPISIIASGVDNNVPFTRQATILAIVRPSDARLTGSYIELPKDENNDSLYEGLDFLISVTATSPQNYGLLAGLEKNGQPITFAVQDVVLVPGEQVVTIRFDGNDIRRSQLDGPYTVSNLSLFDKDLGVPAQFFESAWVTEPYNFHDFGACHSLTIVQNPSFGGTINTSPTPNCNNGTQYSVDTEVALTAAPNSGYIFTNWIAAASGTSNPIQVVMDNDKTVAANFLEITWSEPAVITMTADPVEIAADGTSISTIMVTIMDANGNVIPIQNVTFETTLGTLSTISETTNSAGVVTVALTSSASGMAIVTAKAGAAIGTVQVNLIAPYIPGDCNNDQTVGAADLTALALEFFDGDDNNDPNDTPNGAYPGTPACDANEDGRIGASDLTCIALIFFNGPGACQVGQSAAAHSQPTLVIPDDLVAEAGGQVTVPIVLQGNGAEVSSLLFSIDYDERWLTIDPADHDEDGVPDAIVFNLPDHFVRSVTIDLNDASGELDIMIASFASPAHVLPEGELLSITFGLGNSADTTEATIAFAQQPEPSLGDRSGHAISGSAQDGAVRIVATGESGSASVLHLPMISR